MRRFFAIVALLLLGTACDKDEAFTCKVVDSEATNITQTTATLEATINASDFGKVERVGFMVGDDFYKAELGRVFSVVVDGLKPNTEYEYRIMIYALGDVWNKEGSGFIVYGWLTQINAMSISRIARCSSVGSVSPEI